jgi:branched-chain amino acid transport system permease protein
VPLSGVIYPQFEVFGLRGTQSCILLGAVVFALLAALLMWAKRGRFGRLCAAVRDNPVEAQSIGINVRAARVVIFAVGSAIGGAGGVLVGIEQGAVGVGDFALLAGLVWLAVVVTVGVRGYRGALLAGVMFTVAPAAFQYVHVSGIGQLPTVLFGLGAIGLAREPRGFLYEMEMRIRGMRSKPGPTGAVGSGARGPTVPAARAAAPLEGVGQ